MKSMMTDTCGAVRPVRIKVLFRGANADTPDFEYRPGFVFVFDPACTDYDWLVVYDEMPTSDVGTFRGGYEALRCPKECTILVTTEPTSIKRYSRAYTRQFGHLLTNRPQHAENHPHYHLGRGYYWWYIDRDYEECVNLALPEKNRLISVVCSSKRMRHTKHSARYVLVETLSKKIPEMDWYGRGVHPIGKKHEALDPYRYHVTIENHIKRHHWSEKLSDAFLSECLPFYAGDPDLVEAFPKDSFIPIPIDDPEGALEIIKESIANCEYEKRREAVLEAKRLILEKYNFWAQVIEVVDSERFQETTAVDSGRQVRIFERKVLRRRNILAMLEEGFIHLREYGKRLFKA